jgi:hypothetical protein
MTSVSGISPLSSVRVLQGSTQTIAAINAPLAGTVYSYTLPSGTRRFSIVADEACLLKYGTSEANINNGDFWPISGGADYTEQFLNLSSTTIFFTSDKPNDTVRVNSWA